MIRINLASRKQSVGLQAGDGGKTRSGLGLNFNTDAFKGVPLRKPILFLATVGFAIFLQSGIKEEELKKWNASVVKATEEQTKLQADLAKTKGFEEIKKSLEADEVVLKSKIETIKKLIADRQTPPKLLVALSGGVPNEVWLSEIRLSNTEIALKGYSLGFNEISDLMKNLNDSAFFMDSRLVSTVKSKDETGLDVATFDVSAKRR